ncbi:unnamed protein product [Prunus armeniaca]|uniref:Uncharacterized protein n=1 Tax=Prunus armeniaca TaxID=36596 RepID=A0A6J5UG98_PRUAR|nr:unnamed protein product [Prunus armeniaca]
MVKLLLLAGYLVFMIVIQVRTELVQASTRLPFLINSQDLEPYEYVTITEKLTCQELRTPSPCRNETDLSVTRETEAIIFLQDATMTATQPVAIAISANSLHYACYVVEKTLDLMKS